MSAVVLRDAVERDLPRLVELYESSGVDTPGSNTPQSISHAWSRLHREAPSARVLVAERDGLAVGTLTCFVLPQLLHGGTPTAVVEAVAVHPDAQGEGVGRALMDGAMAIAREAGCYKLALSSNLKREAAHRFYDQLGFERHGVSFVVTPATPTETAR